MLRLYLQDDVVEADQVLWAGSSLVLVGFRLLQFGLQSVGHALIPLHQRAQLDVGQVTGRGDQQHIYYSLKEINGIEKYQRVEKSIYA